MTFASCAYDTIPAHTSTLCTLLCTLRIDIVYQERYRELSCDLRGKRNRFQHGLLFGEMYPYRNGSPMTLRENSGKLLRRQKVGNVRVKSGLAGLCFLRSIRDATAKPSKLSFREMQIVSNSLSSGIRSVSRESL